MSKMNDLQETLPLTRPVLHQPVGRGVIHSQKDELHALNLAISVSGLDNHEIAAALGIDASQFTKIKDGAAHFPIRRLLKFCETVQNDILIEYLAYRRGYALVMLESETQRQLREAQEALAKEKERTRLLTEVLQGTALR